MFTGNFIAKFDDHSLCLVPVPLPNLDVPSEGKISLLPGPPSTGNEVVVDYPFDGPIGQQTALLLSPSQPHAGFPLTLDAYQYNPVQFEVTRYSVEFTEGPEVMVNFALQTTYTLPNFLGELTHFDESSPLEFGYPSRNLMYVDFSQDYSPGLCVLSVMNPSGPDSHSGVERRTTGERAALTMLHPVAIDIEECTLCSTSGRSVYTASDWEGKISVWVVDYLSPRSN